MTIYDNLGISGMLAPPAIFIMRPPHYLYALMLAMYCVMAAATAAVWEMSEDNFSDTPRDKTTLIIDLYTVQSRNQLYKSHFLATPHSASS